MATPRSHFRSEDVKASLSCSRHALSQVASVANGTMPTASLLKDLIDRDRLNSDHDMEQLGAVGRGVEEAVRRDRDPFAVG
jgi:hypothetical protein